MPRNNRFPPMMTMALTFALTLCATACAFSAQPGAAHRLTAVPCAPMYELKLPITPTLKWTPDGSGILFGKGSRLYTVASDGSNLHNLAGSTPSDQSFAYDATGTEMGLSADVSPDGSRIVYTTCEYITEPKPWHHGYADEHFSFLVNYELATAGIDGLHKDRLTENLAIDHYPTWSPDGSRIAFASNILRTESGEYDAYRFQGIEARSHEGVARIYTIDPDGSDLRTLTPAGAGAVLFPPRWSPDGERVAFIGGSIWDDRPDLPAPYVLYTATADGLNLRTIAGAAGAPSWSPDGQRLAFTANVETPSGYKLVLRSASADGGDVRDVAEIEEIVNGGNMFESVLTSGGGVSWSPDGSAFIVSAQNANFFNKAFIIGDDGSELQSFVFSHAEWSPDGNRIAVVAWYGHANIYEGTTADYRAREMGDVFLFIVTPNGYGRRDLVAIDEDGELRVANPR